MRFLILAYSYPPAANPRAIRFGALAEHWADSGHDVDVVCGWSPGRPRREVRNGVRILRVGGNLSERLRAGIRPQTIRNETNKTHTAARPNSPLIAKTGRHLKKLARVCHDLTWKKLYWPDANCLWYAPALKAARTLISSYTYDAMISVSIPFTSHLVAHSLQQQMRDVPWLVDSGDPYSFLEQCPPNNTRLYRKFNVAWERKIFSAASTISVTSERTAQKYRDCFPECAAKIHVIPPLATLDSGADCRFGSNSETNRPIKLVYAGTLYRNIRNPTFLFELFSDLLQTELGKRLELHLYGLSHDCSDLVGEYRRKHPQQVHVHGQVNPHTAQRAVAEADVLVNLGNSTDFQLPSKVVDYAATGKPILNLISIVEDSSARFLKTHPGTLTVRQSSTADKIEHLQRVAEFIVSPPRIDFHELQQWMKPYEIGQVAAKYLELVTEQEMTPTSTVEMCHAA